MIAAGRNPKALARAKELGADAVIPLGDLSQKTERETLVSALRGEIAGGGVDVVLDYLWGAPAEAVLAAIAQKGLSHETSRIRFVQIGSSAVGDDYAGWGDAAELRAGAAGKRVWERVAGADIRGSRGLMKEAAKKPFQMEVETAALRDVTALWTRPENGARPAFQP